MSDIFIGIDNGVTGGIAILNKAGMVLELTPTPTRREISYTKKKQFISRVNVPVLREILRGSAASQQDGSSVICLLERPFTFPGRLKAMLSGFRALEATLIVLEELGIPYQYIDSKEWQKALLPTGLKGPDLKVAAENISCRLFPGMKAPSQGECDALLIAEYARRTLSK